MTVAIGTRLNLMVIAGEDDYSLVRDLLGADGPCQYELDWVATPSSGFKGLSATHDAILLGHDPAERNTLELVRSLMEGSGYAVPIVLLTGCADDAIEVELMEAGASDWLPKKGLTRELLERSIGHAIERCRILEHLEGTRREQLRAKDELLSHVSHELRTPVAAIYQFVSLVADEVVGQVNESQHELLGIVLKNVESLSRMINDLLDTSRAQGHGIPIQIRRTHIDKAVGVAVRTLEPRARAGNITLTACPVPPMVVQADPGRLLQVIINLIDNAIKYTPSGGQVSVDVCRSPENEGYVRLCVADTGPGIAPEDRKLLFKPLAQLPRGELAGRQGLGLGLHICNEIVMRHGGQLWVESNSPHGSRFCFTLPIFSISEAVRGTVEKARVKSCDVVLFEIRLGTAALPSQVAWRLLDQAHWVVRHATSPGDLVLPASEDDDERGVIHVVAALSRSRAPALAAQITTLLMEEVDVYSRGKPEIVFEVVGNGGNPEDLPGDWVARIVDRIRARVA